MTHTLHPEIQDAVDKLVSEITKLKPGYYNADCLLDLERMILKCVGKYLSLPKPTPQIEKIDQQFAEKIVDWLINKYNLRYEPF